MNIVITGASKGIGKGIAKVFAADGANLFLCSRNLQSLMALAEEIQSEFPGVKIYYQAVDLSVKESAIAFGKWVINQTIQNDGRPTVDILINNAGSYLPGSIHNEQDGVLEKMIQTNLMSAYHLTRTLIGVMIAAERGHIFNMCSIASLQAYQNGGSYSISKFALMGFSKNLREELKEKGIKVTTVYPGAVMTDSWGDFDNSSGRILEVKDIADMILAASKLSLQAVVEDIVIRPQLGDL